MGGYLDLQGERCGCPSERLRQQRNRRVHGHARMAHGGSSGVPAATSPDDQRLFETPSGRYRTRSQLPRSVTSRGRFQRELLFCLSRLVAAEDLECRVSHPCLLCHPWFAKRGRTEQQKCSFACPEQDPSRYLRRAPTATLRAASADPAPAPPRPRSPALRRHRRESSGNSRCRPAARSGRRPPRSTSTRGRRAASW